MGLKQSNPRHSRKRIRSNRRPGQSSSLSEIDQGRLREEALPDTCTQATSRPPIAETAPRGFSAIPGRCEAGNQIEFFIVAEITELLHVASHGSQVNRRSPSRSAPDR
jgi:hypothetical protein